MDDFELLQAYAKNKAESAFATLVGRYLNLVYSAALRQTHEPQAADDITQAVFIVLARKAATFRRSTVLSGWLLRTTQYTAWDARRREQRRQQRERQSMDYLQPTESEATWQQIAPLLDAALVKLSEKDHSAIVLRYFEQKSHKEVGQALGMSENSARMRVTRALERLRRFFTGRGITLSAVTLGAMLSANAVQAAPAGMAGSVTAVAVANGVGATAVAVVSAAEMLKLLAWARLKTAAMIGVPAMLMIATAIHMGLQIGERFAPENLARNGDFAQGLTHWHAIFWQQSEATATVGRVPGTTGQAVKFSITRIGLVDTFEFVQAPVPIKAGHKYTISFGARSTATQPVRVLVTKDKAPWTFYGFRVSAEIGPRWRNYRLSSRAMLTAEDGRIVFRCRGALGDIWIANIKFQDRGP